jgi:hypothetical protein
MYYYIVELLYCQYGIFENPVNFLIRVNNIQ